MANPDENVGNAVADGFDGLVLLASAHVVDVARDGVFHQHGLKHVGNFVGKATG